MESSDAYTYSPYVRQRSAYDVCFQYFYGTGSDGQPKEGGLVEKLSSCMRQGLNLSVRVQPPLDFLLESLDSRSQHEILCHWHYRCHGMTCMDDDFGRSGDPAEWCDLCENLKPVILEETIAGIEYLKLATLIGNSDDTSPTSSDGTRLSSTSFTATASRFINFVRA
jgi:hypothetical protein